MSIDSIHIILDLILKSWAGTLTQPEEERLNELLEDPEWARLKQDLEDDRFIMGRFKEYEKYDKIADFSCFLKRIRKHKKRRVLTASVRRTIYVAASLLVFVMAGGVWWSERTAMISPEEGREIVIETTIDRNSVRLILGDNRMIPLTHKNEAIVLGMRGILHSEGLRTLNYKYVKSDSLENVSEYHTLIVPKGERQKVIFSDSSWVILNAQSTMKYPVAFRGEERKVYVEGEAYFEVTKDTTRPFIVEANGMEVKVYGTQFNVNSRRDDQIQTTLVEGSVSVKPKGLAEVMLKPNQQAVFNKLAGRVSVRDVDVMSYVAWQRGNYYFENKSIGEILDELSLWYDIQVFFVNNEVRNERFSGYLPRYEEINGLLSLIEKTSHVQFEIKGRVIIVRK